jgi:hypothetical protein
MRTGRRHSSKHKTRCDDANHHERQNANSPPVIQINGENPVHVSVGATYQDLGATITAPDADKNLGIKTFLNSALISDIVLDTSAVATDTIQYVVTDPTGLTATSTRTIIVNLRVLLVPSTRAGASQRELSDQWRI